ncbi:MAG: hypothetical protein SGARI_001200 [Bacillariaceae sp.]
MVAHNDGGFGAGFGMRTSSSVSAFNHMNTKQMEAELINKATQTAIVAARSILMSGGSEEVALKTAKAAAESVLNPQASDNDTVSGRSTVGSVFGGRKRKAKRQAEVVASMALMSASSGIRHAGSSMDMSEWNGSHGHSHGQHHHNNPYGRNIITFRQDEPSVLSGSISTRPPRIPTPKSHTSNPTSSTSAPKMTHSSSSAGIPMPSSASATMTAKSPRKSSNSSRSKQPAVDTSSMFFPSPHSSPALEAGNTKESPAQQESSKPSKEKVGDTTPKNSEKNTSSSTPTPKPLTPKLFEMESDSVSQNDTMDSEQQSSVESSLGDEYSATDTATIESDRHHKSRRRRESKDRQVSANYDFDPLLVKVTKALNIFTCGPLGAFSGGQAAEDLEELEGMTSPAGRGRADRSSAAVENRDDTFDDNTTNYTNDDTNTEMTGREGSDFRDPDFGLIVSQSSDSSNELLRELMSETSEGAIQVRSSIRETMEKIVSKSKKGHRRGASRSDSRRSKTQDDIDKKWLSYELRQKDDEPEIPVLSSKKKSKKSSAANSSRRTPKNKGGASGKIGKKQSFFFKKNKG